jgi:hypothetical protein
LLLRLLLMLLRRLLLPVVGAKHLLGGAWVDGSGD